MAISISFNGATIYQPGAYSEVNIDLGGGFPLSPTGLIAIFGESTSGAPGATLQNLATNVFNPSQAPQIAQQYGSGPIVDACNFLFAPGSDGAIPGGAQAVYIYKTNASTQASLALANNWGTVYADAWGLIGNKIQFSVTQVPATPAATTSTTTFDTTNVAIQGLTMILNVNGGPVASEYTFTVPDTVISRATLTTALAASGNWTGGIPAGLTFLVSGSTDATAQLTITRVTTGTPNSEGFGRNFEVVGGTLLTYVNVDAGLYTAESENQAIIYDNNLSTLISETDTVGGDIVISIGRVGGVAPSVSVNATNIILTNNSMAEYTLPILGFDSINELATYISSNTGGNWNASVPNTLFGTLPVTVLDQVTGLGAEGSTSSILPAQIKMDAYETIQFFANSSAISLTAGTGAVVGLPSALALTFLSGGVLGGTPSSEITNALTKFQKFHVNAVIPLFSRDATEDVLDGITDPSSTYTIAAIHQAVKTHCSLMATTKNRSERQGYLSMHDTYANCKTEASIISDYRQQLVIQDIMQTNSLGNLVWFLPWAGACLLAGARGGSPVGLPMTGKFFNMSGIRQTGQLLSTPAANIVIDFDPDLDYDDAIMSGITFWEAPQTGGFQLDVDNTTYNTDDNWVYNRANVLYAADVLAFDFRSQLQSIYVGVKNTVTAAEIASTCTSILNTYLAQGITVSTSDAKSGFKQLVVQLNGNTVNISVVVKLVEGIDFILADITLQRASSSSS